MSVTSPSHRYSSQERSFALCGCRRSGTDVKARGSAAPPRSQSMASAGPNLSGAAHGAWC
eukprot:scaffold7963_cov34-Tisochrysis_lutea.AAC.2